MEAAIRRGRLLRELLKQERLVPETVEFQLAWLLAFNESLFDEQNPEQVAVIMKKLAARVSQSGLSLSTERDVWLAALRDWFKEFSVRAG